MSDTIAERPMTASFLHRLRAASPLLWWTSMAFLICFALCLVLQTVDQRLLNGISVWIKPAKFFLSLALHMLTLAWGISLLPQTTRSGWTVRVMALYMMVAACGEMIYIAGRAALGQASHFNTGTPLSSLLYSLMGLGAVGMLVVTAVIGTLILLKAPPSLMTRAAGAGFILAAVLTLVTAGTLGGMGSHWIGGDQTDATGLPLLGWSTTGGDLRVSHFVSLHLMQAIPLAALTGRSLAVLAVAIAGIAAAAATYAQALMGYPLVAF